MKNLDNHPLYKKSFSGVYDCYIARVEKNWRTKAELDEIICWMTWYTQEELDAHLEDETDFETFYGKAKMNKNCHLITGTVCGIKVQEVDHPLMKKIRMLDKLYDELCKGRKMEKILRQE